MFRFFISPFRLIFGFLSFLLSAYMLILIIRVLLSWFGNTANGSVFRFLRAITDPYINWFRRFSFLRAGFFDLSPIAAFGVLSLVNRVLGVLALYGTISAGIILVIAVQIVWGALSFFTGFLIIVLILRLIAAAANFNTYSPFWSIIDSITSPVIFRIRRLPFMGGIRDPRVLLAVSAALLLVLNIVLGRLVSALQVLLLRLPV